MAGRDPITPAVITERWVRGYVMHSEGCGRTVIDVSRGSEPYVKSRTLADTLAPAVATIEETADFVENPLGSENPEKIDAFFRPLGQPRRPAVGSSGQLIVQAKVGGGNIAKGQLVRHKPTNNLYRVVLGHHYTNGDLCTVAAVKFGAATNLDAGEELEWVSPPYGILPTSIVGPNGLSGGAEQESNARYIERINRMRAFPGVLGNEDKVHEFAIETADIAIDRVYSWASVPARGMTSVGFTIVPATLWDSRVPNAAQIALVRAYVESRLRHEDMLLWPDIVDHDVEVALGLRWKATAAGWVDTTPWPQFTSPLLRVRVLGSPTPTASSFAVQSNIPTNAPLVGQTVALWSPSADSLWIYKRISAVTTLVSGVQWLLTIDNAGATTPSANHVPVAGRLVSPYAPDLENVGLGALQYFATLGPGEMVASIPLGIPGYRQRRYPASPDTDPSTATTAITQSLYQTSQLAAAAMLDDIQIPTPTGTPGILVYLLKLQDAVVFPQ